MERHCFNGLLALWVTGLRTHLAGNVGGVLVVRVGAHIRPSSHTRNAVSVSDCAHFLVAGWVSTRGGVPSGVPTTY